MPLKPDGDCHDLQARTGRRAKLAPSRRSQPIAKGGHWDKVHRRHPRRQPTATSRLTPPSPRFGYSSGQFLVNGVSQPTNQDVYVTDAQLGQTTYQSGSGTDTLWVRAYDGIKWGDWSSSFTVTASGETSASSTSSDPGAREAREIA